MKKILILILLLVPVMAFSQVKVYTDQLITDSITINRTDWINEFSKDGTMGGNSDKALPTEKAVKTYVDANSTGDAAAISDSIAPLKTDIASLEDSIATHTDSLQSHNTRLKAIEAGEVGYDIPITYQTAPRDTIIGYDGGGFSWFTLDELGYQDSLNTHTDTLQLHDTRLNTLEDSTHTHSNKAVLDATTSSFTTAKNTRLEGVNDTIMVMINVTTDTLTSTADSTGWVLPINRTLNGCNLIYVEAFSSSNGNGTADIDVIRLRSAAIDNVTSTGADISGVATINTDNDDVITGDYYNFTFKETGATTYTIGVDVYLKFLRP